MANYKREEGLVEHLMDRLSLRGETADPKATGQETGTDVTIRLGDGRVIGIQVTEIDPFTVPGSARAEEKKIAKTVTGSPYGMLAQNDSSIVIDAVACRIEKKVTIAARHPFHGLDEVWLLLCAGVPEHGAVASTFVMTPLLAADDLNEATGNILSNSKYDRCFLLPILGAEEAFYHWENGGPWHKSVILEDISDAPRKTYVAALMRAEQAENWREVDRLCDEECRHVLAEMRGPQIRGTMAAAYATGP